MAPRMMTGSAPPGAVRRSRLGPEPAMIPLPGRPRNGHAPIPHVVDGHKRAFRGEPADEAPFRSVWAPAAPAMRGTFDAEAVVPYDSLLACSVHVQRWGDGGR